MQYDSNLILVTISSPTIQSLCCSSPIGSRSAGRHLRRGRPRLDAAAGKQRKQCRMGVNEGRKAGFNDQSKQRDAGSVSG